MNGSHNIKLKRDKMSRDIRRKYAYFGPREKVYQYHHQTELPNFPLDWRRILCISYRSPVIGPFGCVYDDIEHAMCAYRYLHTTNEPMFANYFRSEYESMRGSNPCRIWGQTIGMSRLRLDPNDRVWNLLRDRCMFDLIIQRIGRDPDFAFILGQIIELGYTPVYHIRTSTATTYWGATLDKSKISNTSIDRNPPSTVSESDLKHLEATWSIDTHEMLIGKNRLGTIMVDAYNAFKRMQHQGLIPNQFGAAIGQCAAIFVPLCPTPHHQPGMIAQNTAQTPIPEDPNSYDRECITEDQIEEFRPAIDLSWLEEKEEVNEVMHQTQGQQTAPVTWEAWKYDIELANRLPEHLMNTRSIL